MHKRQTAPLSTAALVTDLTTINGRHVTLGPEIGHGRDTLVYAGTLDDGRPVAVKVFDAAVAQRVEHRHLIAAEMRVARRLCTPHLVTTLDVGLDAGHPFIVMEYLAGGDLQRRIGDGVATWSHIRETASALCRAVADIHHLGYVHGDLKPRNVLFDTRGHLKVGDFGLTRPLRATGRHGSSSGVGTIGFVAPEVVRGETPGPRADVYALGVILFLLATGRMPFVAASPLALALVQADGIAPAPARYAPGLPPAFDTLVQRCLAREPRHRFRDAGALLRAVRSLPQSSDDALAGPLHTLLNLLVGPTRRVARQVALCSDGQ